MKPAIYHRSQDKSVASSREDAWIETALVWRYDRICGVASSREDAWIETLLKDVPPKGNPVASSREYAWIETRIPLS